MKKPKPKQYSAKTLFKKGGFFDPKVRETLKSIGAELAANEAKYGGADGGTREHDTAWVQRSVWHIYSMLITHNMVELPTTGECDFSFENAELRRDGTLEITGTKKGFVVEARKYRLFDDVEGAYETLNTILNDYPKQKVFGKL